jgi:hypothetical protein
MPTQCKWIFGVLGLVLLLVVAPRALAAEGELTISDREIIERLTRLEEGQKAINKRIDDVNRRFDDLRSELKGDIGELGKRVDDLRSLIYVVLGGMIALIGFVIWDRRTALSPVIRKTRELEEDQDMTLKVLKEYAQREPKLAEVMKSLRLL